MPGISFLMSNDDDLKPGKADVKYIVADVKVKNDLDFDRHDTFAGDV